jgi:branched-chain amino acid transport system substrate-binding protein
MSRRDSIPLAFRVAAAIVLAFSNCMVTPAAEQASKKAASQDKRPPIKIGFIAPLTGASAFQGHGLLNGINLFMEQNHNQIAGRNVELIVANDGSSPATALGEMHKLVDQDHCDVITGLLLTNIGDAVAAVSDHYKTPLVFAVAAGDQVTQRHNYKWVIRTAPSCSEDCLPFGDWVYKNLGYKRVVTFGMDYVYGWEMVGAFQKSFEEAGGKVIQKIWAPMGITDFTSYMKQIRPDADAVFMLNVGGAVKLVPKEYVAAGQKLPIIGGGTCTDEVLLHDIGEQVLGAVTVLNYSPEINTPENKRFVKAYMERFGAKPSFYSDGSYTAALLIKKGIESVNGNVDNKEKFMAAMRTAKLVDAPRGLITFDGHNQAIMNMYVRKVEKVNGKYQNSVIYTFPNVSQFWKYKPSEYLKEPVHTRDFPPCKYCGTN